MNTIEILTKARDIIASQPDVAKEVFQDARGCFCTVGAVAYVINPKVSRENNGENSFIDVIYSAPTNDVLRKLLSAGKFGDHFDLYLYNDKSTRGDIIELFNKAIAEEMDSANDA